LNPEKGEGAGIGHYTYQLVRHLLSIDKKNTYILFFDRSVQKKRLAKFKQNNVFIRFFPFVQYSRLMPVGYSHFLVSAILDREKLDVFHSPVFSLPSSYKGNSVITVHDLGIYKFPELYLKENVGRLKRDIPRILKQARKIIAVSNSTARDLKKIFNLSNKKIRVIFNGLDKRFFKKETKTEVKKIKHKYGIKKNYFLFLGTLDPRKNIVQVISAYEQFRNKLTHSPEQSKNYQFFDCQLVLAGAKGTRFVKIQRKISLSKYKKDIILPGYIPADDLNALFAGADIFIFPSLHEGFGLPVIEAMAKGVPVITSNISSMPEIAKGVALLIDPYNVAKIAQSMYNLSVDRDLRRKLSIGGRKRAGKFCWRKCARQTLGVYKEAAAI